MSKRIDLTGQRFGKLQVKEMLFGVESGNRKRTKCLCLCDCGSEHIADADKLRSGIKTSCGCDSNRRRAISNRRDLTGRRFGRLVVKKMIWETRPTKAECLCDCGRIVTVIATGLTSGKTGSCGCLHKDRTSITNTKDWKGIVSKYNIELVEPSYKDNKGKWFWKCKCGLCGNIFDALPAKIMSGHTTSCGCRTRSSHEQFIRTLLNEWRVPYIEQYRFPDCRNKYTLPFDFAIMEGDTPIILIEYDGIQHYKPIDVFGGDSSYNETLKRDKIKDQFCEQNNYKLIRLPYYFTEEQIKNTISSIIYP